MTRTILTLTFVTCIGCDSAGETKTNEDVATPPLATSATTSRSRVAPQDSARKEQPLLAEDEVRVALVVLPGNAQVEVDNVSVRRRHGAVELVGKVGDERRVRVFLGTTRTEERIVKIEATGASPALIDASAPSLWK
jgi:hypothetical protein